MESIQNWAMSLCGAAVLCGLLGCIMPDKLGGKTVLSLFFLCILAAPLGELWEVSIEIPWQEQEEISAELEQGNQQLAYSLAEGHILELIRETLSERGFPTESLQVSWTEEELSLTMELLIELKSREEELREILREQWGIESPNIKWQEEQ